MNSEILPMLAVDLTMYLLLLAPTALFLDFCISTDSTYKTVTPEEQQSCLTMPTETTTEQTKN